MFSFKTHPSYSLWMNPECPLPSACSLARLNSRTNQISRPHQKQHQCRSVHRRSGPYLVQNLQNAWALENKTRLWNPCTKIWSRIWWRSKRPRILLYEWKTRLTRTMPHANTSNRTLRPAPIHKDRLHRQENCQKYDKAAFVSRQPIE